VALMALRVVGAGLGRTGTHSLKLALERLTGGRCYHMTEAFGRPGDTAVWRAAVRGETAGLIPMLKGYTTAVDWPACAFWEPLAEANPDAVVLLSVRDSAEQWWRSCERTIFQSMSTPVPDGEPDWADRRAMMMELLDTTFTPHWPERAAAMAAYEEHNARVRARADPARLVEWRPSDGWQPVCAALRVMVPDEPFPKTNTTEEFRERAGLDAV
jgi:hypothetical protein